MPSPGDVLSAVHDELRRLAATKLAGEKPGHALDATALVHEAEEMTHHYMNSTRPRISSGSSTSQMRTSPAMISPRLRFLW